MPVSLDLDEIRALVELLSSYPLSPALQTAAIKLRGALPADQASGAGVPLQENGGRSLRKGLKAKPLSFAPHPQGQGDFPPTLPLQLEGYALLPTGSSEDATQVNVPTSPPSQEVYSPEGLQLLAPSVAPNGLALATFPKTSKLKIRIPVRRPRSPSPGGNEIENREADRLSGLPTARRRRPNRRAAGKCSRGGVKPPDYAARLKLATVETESEEQEHEGNETLSTPVPEEQVLAPKPKRFLAEIATACDLVVASKDDNAVSRLVDALLGQAQFVGRNSVVATENSLQNLALRCHSADQNIAINDFLYMLYTIQLRVGVLRAMRETGRSCNQVLQNIQIQCDVRSLWRYFKDGGKFCALAGAGTILLLMIIAGARLRAKVRDQELTEDGVLRLSYVLRCPTPDDEAGRTVSKSIIPAISILRERYRFTFSSFFSSAFLTEHVKEFDQSSDISADLDISDFIFDSFTSRAIVKTRSKASWVSCYPSLPASVSPPAMAIPPDDPNVFVVNTGFDFNLKENTSTRQNGARKLGCYQYTESERKKAEMAVKPLSLSDLEAKLISQLKSGKRECGSPYIEISHNLLGGQRLRVNAKNGELGTLVLPDMPTHLRSSLMDTLKLVFPKFVEFTDSKLNGEGFEYPSLRFCWYNKYCLQGKNARADEEPAAYELRQQAATGKNKRAKTPSAMPYTTADLQRYADEYVAISNALAPVFDWLFAALSQLLPSEMKIIAQFAEVLPLDAECPALPFAGFAINFNVSTMVHRDKDRCLCIVLLISENCQGGNLCLEELGIKFCLENGDVVAFPSQKISHFNTHFKGERVSIVFHTDADSESWIQHRNFWDHSLYMQN